MKPNKKQHNYLRDIVFERDSYTCIFCTNGAQEMHHYVKRSQGGRDIPMNLVAVCRRCHRVIHGEIRPPVEFCRDDYELRMVEYLSDYYGGIAWMEMLENAYRRLERDAIAEYGGG